MLMLCGVVEGNLRVEGVEDYLVPRTIVLLENRNQVTPGVLMGPDGFLVKPAKYRYSSVAPMANLALWVVAERVHC